MGYGIRWSHRMRNTSALIVCVILILVSVTSQRQRARGLAPAWQAGTYYTVGTLASYGSVDYRALQAHTAQTGWEPPTTPALWEPAGTPPPPTTGANPTATRTPTQAPGGNLALGKPALSSSNETTSLTPNLAVDGNGGTRWASAYSDPQWLRVDLGATTTINRVVLRWEAAYGRAYQIQTSKDGTTWTTIYTTTTGDGGVDDLAGLAGSGRYVRMNGTARGTSWGYSLWELEVYGAGSSLPTATRTRTPTTCASGCATPTRTRTRTSTTGTAATPTRTRTSAPPPAGVFFDDFSYTSNADPNLSAFQWTVRTGGGGPGVAGASWQASNIGFTADPANSTNRLMQISASSAGSGANTTQAEIYQPRKFFEGTYASRIKFVDVPLSGPDGDHIVETFFTITPLAFNLDPAYSELDFEYLANGGWGTTGPTFFMTTWESYQPDPWVAQNESTAVSGSFAGWHTVVMQVSGGQVKYYIDGVLRATHSGANYPESIMSLNYNLWFIEGGLVASTTPRKYTQDVDWVYYARNAVLTPAQVDAAVGGYRGQGTPRQNTLP